MTAKKKQTKKTFDFWLSEMCSYILRPLSFRLPSFLLSRMWIGPLTMLKMKRNSCECKYQALHFRCLVIQLTGWIGGFFFKKKKVLCFTDVQMILVYKTLIIIINYFQNLPCLLVIITHLPGRPSPQLPLQTLVDHELDGRVQHQQ